MKRREFLFAAAAAPLAGKARMTPTERVGAVLSGGTPDRAPFSFWHHFGLQTKPPVEHAKATLDFQRTYRLDIVKVMSDFPYPKPESGAWWALKPVEKPFPAQLEALGLIRDGLAKQKYFLETIFNPWNVAEKLSSPEEVKKLMSEKPQALLDALEAITKSEAAHAKSAIETGASGVFLAIANAQDGLMTREEYRKFSAPFDRMILEAVKDAPMNTLHLHGDKVYLDEFWEGWPAAIINYSAHGTKVPLAEARRKTSKVLMGGLNEATVARARLAQVQKMIEEARAAAPKWICAPGCSVPDNSSQGALFRLTRACATAG
jgi:uroporphyrinogen decarboxylase